MDALDLFRIGLRWLHALAAVLWLGGSLFFWLVLRPALDDLPDPAARSPLAARLAKDFGGLVQLAIGVLVMTGAILSFDRLSQSAATPLYMGVLALKVALALGMFWLVLGLARGRARARPSAPRPASGRVTPQAMVLSLGLLVYLLAEALKVLFEGALRAA
ncbi:MAG: hypothetical protein HY689_02290 [Chloroflexi bacterium]|nr:hypothetical protein [Chloroflexota bacterium]